MMIYMGKNPRLTSATRDFQFAISQYLGKAGQSEMWSDKLVTKFLAGGLLALNLMGCVQTTDGVYSKQGEDWKESSGFFDNQQYQVQKIINSKVGDFYSILDYYGKVILTKDFKTSEVSNALLQNFSSGEKILDAGLYKIDTYITVVTTSLANYYTADYVTWNYVPNITPQKAGSAYSSARCGYWKTPNAFYIKKDLDLWLTSDFNTWTKFTLPFEGSVYITDDYIFIGTVSTDSMIKINKSFEMTTVSNILKTSSYGSNSVMGVSDNVLYAYSPSGISFSNKEFTSSTSTTFTTPFSSTWGSTVFYNNRIYFIKSGSGLYDHRVCYIDINKSDTIIDCGYQIPSGLGSNALSLTLNNGVISAFNYLQPNALGVSYDGNTFKSIEYTDSSYSCGAFVYNTELNLYYILGQNITPTPEPPYYKLYTSRGREAGSGIISESKDMLSSNSAIGNVTFSDGVDFKWGNSTPDGADTVVNLPAIVYDRTNIFNKNCLKYDNGLMTQWGQEDSFGGTINSGSAQEVDIIFAPDQQYYDNCYSD